MAMDTSTKIEEILKTMATFNVEEDLADEEAREEFVNYFSEVVNTEDEIGMNFLKELVKRMDDILVDMAIKEPVEAAPVDNAELPDIESEAETTEESYLFKLNVAERANDFLM